MEQTKSGPLIRRVLNRNAMTYIAIELSGAVSMLVDGIVISNLLGPSSMAAFGLASPYFILVSMFSGILATGMQAVVARAMGSGDREQLEEIVSTGLWCMVALSLALTALGLALTGPLCRLLGATGANSSLYPDLLGYTRGWFLGVPGLIVFTVLSPLALFDGNRKLVNIAVIVQTAVNCIGDVLAATVFHGGMFGVALATSLDFLVAGAIILQNFYRKGTLFPLVPRRFSPKALRGILEYGLPKLTHRASKMAGSLLVNRIVLAVGSVAAMTAISVQNNLKDFLLAVGVGIAESCKLVCQILRSEENRPGIRRAVSASLKALYLLAGAVAVLTVILAKPLADLYLDPGETGYELAILALRIFAAYVFLRSVNECVTFYIQAMGTPLQIHHRSLVQNLLFLVPCMWVCGRLLGTTGLFLAFPASELLCLLYYCLTAIWRGQREKRRTGAEEYSLADMLLMLPPVSSDTRELSLCIRAPEDTEGISEKVLQFCRESGIDRRRAYHASLCTEEIVTNLAKHAFPAAGKNSSCDILLLVKGDDLTLRFRDDCPQFDMCSRYREMVGKDMSAGIGIRLVFSAAKDVHYASILNTNTVLVTI